MRDGARFYNDRMMNVASRGSYLRRWLMVLLPLLLVLPPFSTRGAKAQIVEVGDGGPGPFKAQHLTAELVTLAPQIAPGGTLQIGLLLTIEENWHVYWVNAGDSGDPPKIVWTLPQGISAGPMQFPAPERLPLGPLMDFGYEDHVAFPVLLTAAPTLKPGKVHLDAHVNWLVCAAVCLPGKAHLGLDLNVVPGPLPEPPVVGALGEAISLIPKPLPQMMKASVIGDAKQLQLTLVTGTRETTAEFYPFDYGVIDNPAKQQVDPLPDGVKVTVKRAAESTSLPKTMHGVVKFSDTESYELTAPVVPGVISESAANGKKAGATASNVTLVSAIGLALVGGILLNLMPCVFPVLFLKGLALVNSAAEERKRQRLHGLVYTLGILVSFWAIVAALLALRAGGKELGWGFQLQSPGFVAVLAALLFFLGLSLAGQFEIGLTLTSAGGGLAQKQGFAGSFFTGVLATVVATPCTAPLMGAAVGFALAQPWWGTFAVFTAVALGLALPYLLLSLQPQWTRVLPRPGAWMETLKQLTAVPLFGTAIWLTWVYAHLYAADGVDRMTRLLTCFLVLAIAGWVLGKWPAKWGASIVAVLLILFAVALPLLRVRVSTIQWQPYTPASLQAARASGKPVFVDFTAAWCLSCQVNEHAVLESAEIESTLITKDFVLLKADWTQYDPGITQALAAVDRSGVPTYVIYPAGDHSNPDVLPELLTKDTVLKAIDKDTSKQ
jgi:thiol:disulfide interchange protein